MEKLLLKRSNDDMRRSRSEERNDASDDEAKEEYNDKWTDAKRRREASPFHADERKGSSNEDQENKRSNGT